MTANQHAPDADPDEDHADNCVCDLGIHEHEATPDTELPATSGGVDAAEEEADDDDVDGCDLDFNAVAATPDEDLPMAVGGED